MSTCFAISNKDFFGCVFNKKLPRMSMLFIIAFQNIEPGSIWEQERFYKNGQEEMTTKFKSKWK
jgi:hypothetical protein